MRSKALPCELCNKPTPIRSTIRTGDNNGKKVCQVCKTKQPTIGTNNGKKSIPYRRQTSKTKDGPRRNTLRAITPKTAAKKAANRKIRDRYFDHHMEYCERSLESGVRIHSPTRANICHLFPKSNHPSLQGDLENVVYLTLEEHTKFDTYLFRFDFDRLEKEFPNSWEIICNRLYIMAERCEERTKFKSKIVEYLETKGFYFPDFL